MSSPMTLREAVEIVECGRFDYCHPRGPDYDPSDARAAVWDRARAIVDAAVEFIEARAELVRVEALIPYNGANVVKAFNAQRKAEEKLRALERGEGSEAQQ